MSEETTRALPGDILIVDDSSANLKLLMKILTGRGYVVHPASDGELAFRFLRSTLPDLILLDIKMPGMDGFEVCRLIKSVERTRDIPVIFISVLGGEHDKVKAFQAGGVDYIAKPFYPEEVLARVEHQLRLRELTERLEQKISERTVELTKTNQQLNNEIAERRQAEEALRESQQRLDNIVANTPGAIYRCDNDEHWTVRFISAGITQISGYAAEEFINNRVRSYASIIHPDDRQNLADAVASSLARKEHYELDYRLIAKDGALRWVHEQGRGVFDPKGQLLCLDGVILDNTDQREAEEALRISTARLQLATRTAQIGIWDWDVVKNELMWDDSMFQLYGIQAEEFGGAYDAWARTIHPEDKAYAEGEIQAALRGEHEYAPEFRIVWPDGSIRHIKADSHTIHDPEGKPLRMIGTNIDITERKQTEEELRNYKDNLEEVIQQRTAELVMAKQHAENANRAKSVFLANMSHELRTPLNAILGFSSLMRNEPEANESQRQSLDIINRSGEHLLHLLNDILDMAKIESGQVQLESQPFDLGAMVRDITDMMRVRAEAQHLVLQIDQASQFPRYIVGDESRLRQILINLMGNSIKYTEQGGVTLRLSTKNNKAAHLLIEVEDTGTGITAEEQQRIFEPFVQLVEQGVSNGAGLGLTITRQFVQLMGGNITLESEPGKGSLFRVDLPLIEAKESDIIKIEPAERNNVIGLAQGQPEYRILVVEDQFENQLLLTRLMESVGFQTKKAENGEQGVQLFQSWHPHLIWMDRRMPVMDGMEATRRIRELPDGKKVKIIAVTASAFSDQRKEMLTAGMDDYVSKPYRTSEIYDCLSKHLGVKYIYNNTPEPQEVDDILTPEMLNGLPKRLIKELKEALESLDPEQIKTAIQQIEKEDKSLHKKLSQLAASFNYPVILRALLQMKK